VPSRARPRRFPTDHGVYGSPGDLSPWDLRFDPGRRAHLDAAPDGAVRLRVWAEPSLAEGMLVTRSGAGVLGHPMEPVARTIRFTFWEVVAGPFPAGTEYTFAFRAPNGKGVYLVPSGVTNAVERIDRWPLAPPPPMTVPEWAKGPVMYQIFPDRFARGAPVPDPPGAEPWGAPPRSRGFQGGDLPGITARLPYLADLGVEVLYLNPIFTSPSNHRYDTVDYYSVDPMLGGNEALRRLVEEAHRRSIRVILDASFNHVHPRFFAFQDLVRRGRRSAYRGWFVVEDWPLRVKVRTSGRRRWVEEWIPTWEEQVGLPVERAAGDWPPVEPTYQAWYSVPTMPRVDLSHPEARGYMLEVAAHWPREYGIDGWRMDVARYVDPDFWDDFRTAVRAVNPEAYLLCEVMGDASTWLEGERFDATMNYTFRDLCIRFFATGEIDGAEMLDDAARLWASYPWPVTLANQNLLSSHDTPRFLTVAGGDGWRLRLATVFQFTFPGAPGVYYGDEQGMEGGHDPDCRGAFPSDPAGHEVHAAIEQLSRLRRRQPALVKGEWRPLHGAGGFVVFERRAGRRRLVVAINREARPARFDGLDTGSRVRWGEAEIEGSVLTIGPRQAAIAG
jgi:cyclomaltodextrinase / maltogenic alpha-amylase / neopullulanase